MVAEPHADPSPGRTRTPASGTRTASGMLERRQDPPPPRGDSGDLGHKRKDFVVKGLRLHIGAQEANQATAEPQVNTGHST